MAGTSHGEGGRIHINRAPVLTLWAAVVAERLGFDREESLTLGRAVAGLNAQSKGRALGIFKPAPTAAQRGKRLLKPGETIQIELLRRAVPAVRTLEGLRALDREGHPGDPDSVERYLEGKFGDALAGARRAMTQLAGSLGPAVLAERAYGLYERFRPEIPAGRAGWGARGVLDLARIESLAGR